MKMRAKQVPTENKKANDLDYLTGLYEERINLLNELRSIILELDHFNKYANTSYPENLFRYYKGQKQEQISHKIMQIETNTSEVKEIEKNIF